VANVGWERPTDIMWRKNDVIFVPITDVMCAATLWGGGGGEGGGVVWENWGEKKSGF